MSIPRHELLVETKFMEQYRVVQNVRGGSEVVSVRGGDGGVEIFTVGADGWVWNLYPDSRSASGTSSVRTPLRANRIAVGRLGDGRLVVFGANGRTLDFVIQNAPGAAPRWGDSKTGFAGSMFGPPSMIARVYTGQIDGKLYVGILLQAIASGVPGLSVYSFRYSIWDQSPQPFTDTSLTLTSDQCVWTGLTAATAEFACVDQAAIQYNVSSRSITYHQEIAIEAEAWNENFRNDWALAIARSLATAFVPRTGNVFFGVLGDGNLYWMQLQSRAQPTWMPITSGMQLTQVAATVDASNNVHLFALGARNNLWHLVLMSSSWMFMRFSDPALIQPSVAKMSLTALNGGRLDLILTSTPPNTTTGGRLLHMMQQQNTGNWQVTPVEVADKGKVTPYIAYASDLQILGPDRAPLGHADVTVAATAQTIITVNGASFTIDRDAPVTVRTSGSGALTLTQETDALAVPSLLFELPGVSQSQMLVVEQWSGVEKRLATVKGSDLQQATIADGEYLIPGNYRTAGNCDNLAEACNATLALIAGDERGPTQFHSDSGSQGLRWVRKDQGSQVDRIRLRADGAVAHWHFGWAGETLAFRTLSKDEAAARVADWRARYGSIADAQRGFSFKKFLGKLGDVAAAAQEAVIQVVETVVTTLEDAVTTAVVFVWKGVKYLFESAVELVGQAFDLVEMFFTQVAVRFIPLFQWLGFVYAWPDILRSQRAISAAAAKSWEVLPKAIERAKQAVAGKLGEAKDQVDEWVAKLRDEAGKLRTTDPFTTPQGEPIFLAANANNVVLNGLLENESAAAFPSIAIPPDQSGLVGDAGTIWERVLGSKAFKDALNELAELKKDPRAALARFLDALITALGDLIEKAIDGLNGAVQGVLDLMKELTQGIRSLLTTPCTVPFVSDFYAWLTGGQPLTLLNLMSLIVAIPATMLYQAVYGVAPFPDDQSVRDFAASLSTESALRVVSPPSPAQAQPAGYQVFLAFANVAAMTSYGIFSALLDIQPNVPGKQALPSQYALSVSAFSMEFLSQFLCLPAFFGAKYSPPVIDAGTASWNLWFVECWGAYLDFMFILSSLSIAEDSGDNVGVFAAVAMYAVPHAVMLWGSWGVLSGFTRASKSAMLIPELAKIGKLNFVEAATMTPAGVAVSSAIVVALDVICFPVSGALGVFDLVPSDDLGAKLDQASIPGATSARLGVGDATAIPTPLPAPG